MSPLEITRLVLLVTHLIGLAAIIGPFILQLRRKSGFELAPMLVGSIVQLVTGVALIAVRKVGDLPVIDEKMVVKLVLALVVLGAVVVGLVRQRRLRAAGSDDATVRPWLWVAGVAAIANVVVAVFWR